MCNHDNIGARKSQGKIRDALEVAREKRRAGLQAAAYYQQLAEGKIPLVGWSVKSSIAERVLHCGDWVEMLETDEGERKLAEAYFCGKRLCPCCAYRQSLANALVISTITSAMQAEGYTPLLVTLTAPNCTAEELSEDIRRYNKAWDRMLRRKAYKDAWASNIRKIEVTYNKGADTYHPHIHALVYVRASYFGKRYISRDKLLMDWRRAYKDDAITQVDIRKTHGEDWQAISELAKYAAKSGDYLYSLEVFDVFRRALDGKRLMGYSGRCKELRAEFKGGGLREYVEPDLVNYIWRVLYRDDGRSGDYVETQRTTYAPDGDILVTDTIAQAMDEVAD